MAAKYKGTERQIASFLHRYPNLKRHIKKAYQRFNFLFFKKATSYVCNYPFNKISFNDDESFFGYYDKSPMNKDGSYILFHSSAFPGTTHPKSGKSLDITLYNTRKNTFHTIAQTNSWNWQQGSRLQWLDNLRFIYNDYDASKKKYISRICNAMDQKFEKDIDFPVYDHFSDFSISLNFDRLTLLTPDYGYFGSKVKNYSKLPALNEDGIYKTILLKNETRLLYSFEDIIASHYHETMKESQHLINHIMISPNGSKFMFIHRWFYKGIKYHGLMIANCDGSSIKCILDNVMISHCAWYGNEQIMGYIEFEGKVGYHKIDLKSNQITPFYFKRLDSLGDGHPAIHCHKMVIDSYPDKSRMKELYMIDLKSNKLKRLGEFLEPIKYYEDTRCDLHPCWNYNGNKLFINSVHEGKRFLYQIDLTP